MKKIIIAAATLLGAAVGLFWLYAIDAGVNGAEWAPHWRTWSAYITCPFIPLVGLSRIANASVPLLNALIYGLVIYCLVQLWQRWLRASGSRHGADR